MTTVIELGARALQRLGVAVVTAADRPAPEATIGYSEVATAALQELGVVGADETPATADQQLASSKALSVHGALSGSGLVTWASTAIPRAVAEDYIKLTAAQLASSFGKVAGPEVITAFEARVRRYALVTAAGDLATQAVMDLHNELASTGVAEWTTQDIPPGAEEPYVTLAAVALAPTFEKQVDPNMALMARQRLRRLVALPSAGDPVRAEYF